MSPLVRGKQLSLVFRPRNEVKLTPYARSIEEVLGPRLAGPGFHLVTLHDCICPEVLFRRQGLWLGTSWDWK